MSFQSLIRTAANIFLKQMGFTSVSPVDSSSVALSLSITLQTKVNAVTDRIWSLFIVYPCLLKFTSSTLNFRPQTRTTQFLKLPSYFLLAETFAVHPESLPESFFDLFSEPGPLPHGLSCPVSFSESTLCTGLQLFVCLNGP